MTDHTRVVTIEERRGTTLLGVVERHPLHQVRERRGSRTQVEQGRPQGTVRFQKHGLIVRLLRQSEELRAQGMRRLQLGAREILDIIGFNQS